ncbi:hypothetical protein BJ508DRAFT_332329 [Ascobolus immersus RN42]|uniref:DUF6536 domain-containing protein n=1 Tax=Ascobolus immersus RN42 TaxID=1160509 RepID=A0A3N4HTT6_ASCIM|nr:hypothetical protein BJ508DRAFT_332329 [Ascobolus immersus RN42]
MYTQRPKYESVASGSTISTSYTFLGHKKRYSGWRKGVTFAALAALLVAGINIGLTFYVRSRYQIKNGFGIIYEGSCDKSKQLDTWIHLLINALSSALLAASNYTGQVLSAPTRKDVDRAHAKNIWLDIGVPSLRNIRRISRVKSFLWGVLVLSSLPLHLLFNSAVFSTVSTYAYAQVAVAEPYLEDFKAGSLSWNTDQLIDYGEEDIVQYMQNNTGRFQKLDKETCLQEYARQLVQDRRHVIVVTEASSATDEVISYARALPLDATNTRQQPQDWVCDSVGVENCDVKSSMKKVDEWRIKGRAVKYCLSEKMPEDCRLQFNVIVLYIVIGANIVKALTMLIAILIGNSSPLVTLGDAIESFLECPDDTTRLMCLATKYGITHRNHWQRRGNYKQWKGRNTANAYWAGAVSKTRWLACYSLSILSIVALCIFMMFGRQGISNSFGEVVRSGFQKLDTRRIVDFRSSNVIRAVLVANAPQLLISFIYLIYNSIYTCMLLAHEWSTYAYTRKPLRVSYPSGDQKSTYFLQLPYRYAIPLTGGSLLLHWLVSQSLFFSQVRVIDYGQRNYTPSLTWERSVCGYSPLAIILALVVSFVLLAAPLVIGFQKFKKDIPVVGSCSAAISAACHPRPDEMGSGMSLKDLQWGVVSHEAGDNTKGHCTFSALPVSKVKRGCWYAGQREELARHRRGPGSGEVRETEKHIDT